MSKQTVLLGLIFGFLCFALGFFVGREHLVETAATDIVVGQLLPRKVANQHNAIGLLRTINTSEVSYSSTYTTGFSPDLMSLDGDSTPPTANAAGLIDSELASGTRSGYKFTYVPGLVISGVIKTYAVRADPVEPGISGDNHYYTDETGEVRVNERKQAGPNDPLSD